MFSSIVIIYSQLCAFFLFSALIYRFFFCDAYTEGRHTLTDTSKCFIISTNVLLATV